MAVGLLRVLLEKPASTDHEAFESWRRQAFSTLPGVSGVDFLTATDEEKEGNTYGYENAYHVEDAELITTELIESLISIEKKSIGLDRVDFQLYERIAFNTRDDIEPRERPAGTVVVTVGMSPIETEEIIKDFYDWYREEHMPILRDVPGWRTGSRYKRLATFGSNAEFAAPYVAIHQYNPDNGLGGEQWSKSIKSKWTQKVMARLAVPNHRRVWKVDA
ncbi:hypothetical protein ASPVEDRAFT_45863 [Aspergillus versicolor CBS 583.65]|uniref:EthD domain-containing protein n=1 Tax=Aspergillus versicolor CBS 583.65 TaxID=1036611 RepID=A0A1L9PY70_ASPVE|nr:uncharacterized protein ASPVEDRAFT_45863 [Aspergillus versicolor CBS 583.65]OJJ06481.1 hypothetical protein ASPVEDRAFT_45863 [Aspergillus versicolor CBS 583.65]